MIASRKLILLSLAVITIGSLNPASARDTRGTILGTVLDASAAIVPGAAVTITNVATGVTVPGVTDNAGEFNIPFLHPGAYRVTVSTTMGQNWG